MSGQGTIDRLIAVGRPDLAERLKHLAGKHNQARHGWRFAKGGDDAARLGAARRSMRGRDAGERAEYRKRAGMPQVKPMERKQPQPRAGKYPEVPKLKTAREYADWVTANGYAKAANFDKIHPDDAHEIARSLVENGTDFPDARGSLNYVGTIAGYRKSLEGDAEEAWNKEAEKYRDRGIRGPIPDRDKAHFIEGYYIMRGAKLQKGVWGHAIASKGGNAIVVSPDVHSRNRDRFHNDLREGVESGYHPIGTASLKAILDHEYGHIIDYAYSRRPVARSEGVREARLAAATVVYNAIMSWGVKPGGRGLSQGISAYAASSHKEAWAEAWAEFRNNPNPRPAATEIGKLILELGKM